MARGTRRRRTGYVRTPRQVRADMLVLGVFVAIALVAWLVGRYAAVTPPPPPPRLTMEEARAANARIPFVENGLTAAAPFHFHGTPAAKEQAVQCLATAALYEAGADERSQRAVIQVILNRLGLPHYPKTVCGVVYQGATLATGCQFSFTCDGSQARRPEHDRWLAARKAARQALGGYVFHPVGKATHYHADWVVPYWIGSLDKIAQVRSHIFYRPHRPGAQG